MKRLVRGKEISRKGSFTQARFSQMLLGSVVSIVERLVSKIGTTENSEHKEDEEVQGGSGLV